MALEKERTEAEIKCDVEVAYLTLSEDWLIYSEQLLSIKCVCRQSAALPS